MVPTKNQQDKSAFFKNHKETSEAARRTLERLNETIVRDER